jgi:hypothetical protein
MVIVLLAGVDIISGGAIRTIINPAWQCSGDEEWDADSKTCLPGSPFAVGNGAGVYYGPVTPRITSLDAINTGTTYAEGAGAHHTWLRNPGSSGVPSGNYGVLTTGNNTFSVLSSDGGVIFLEASSAANADLYLAVSETLTANSGLLEAYGYTDYDNDAVREHVFRVNYVGLGVQAGMTTMDLPINAIWYKKAGTFTGAVQEPGAFLVNVNNAANNTQVFRYRYTFDSFDTSVLLREMHVRFNSSSTSQWTIDKIEIPMYDPNTGGFVTYQFDQTNVDETVLSTNSTYKYFFANDLSGIKNPGVILASKTGGTKYIDVIVHVTWKLEENAKLRMAIDLRYWDDSEIEQKAIAEIQINDEGPMS